jgi:hypothetical protein
MLPIALKLTGTTVPDGHENQGHRNTVLQCRQSQEVRGTEIGEGEVTQPGFRCSADDLLYFRSKSGTSTPSVRYQAGENLPVLLSRR